MRILVLSDSHSALRFMFSCVDALHPDVIVHLGDHYDDGQALGEQYPHIPLYQVPGNCDRWRCDPATPEILLPCLGGVRMLMTHGHRHKVKQYLMALLADARSRNCAAALFGHTHEPVCYQEADGLWVVNPGSCGYGGGSCALIETEKEKITACRILRQADLEDMV